MSLAPQIQDANANGARSSSDGPSIAAVWKNDAKSPWTSARSGPSLASS